MNKKPELKDGSEWADHEDCIVGDEEGIRNLKLACEKALESGEYFGGNLGDYVGVKMLNDQWFQKTEESLPIRYANAFLGVALVALLALVLIGLSTVIKWLF